MHLVGLAKENKMYYYVYKLLNKNDFSQQKTFEEKTTEAMLTI
jgi:hypothetical protein